MPDIKKGGGLVHHKELRLLGDCPGEENPLSLPVAEAVEILIAQRQDVHKLHGFTDNGPVFFT